MADIGNADETDRRAPLFARGLDFLALVPPVVGAVALFALAVIAIGLIGSGGESGDFWFELARTGLQVLAVAVIGGVAAAAFRRRDDDRESSRRDDEYRASFVSDLWHAYNRVKAVRRELRAVGFQELRGEPEVEQRTTLNAQMSKLNEAQLTLEHMRRTVFRERQVFVPYDTRLLFLLRLSERYARDVLHDWEGQLKERENLTRFVGSSNGRGGINRLTVALERAAALVYSLRSGRTGEHATDPTVDRDLDSDRGASREEKEDARSPTLS